jgi:hypothetical protein
VFDLKLGGKLDTEINEKVIGDSIWNSTGSSIGSPIRRFYCMEWFGVVCS